MSLSVKGEFAPEGSSHFVQMASSEVPKHSMSPVRKTFCDGMISWRQLEQTLLFGFMKAQCKISEKSLLPNQSSVFLKTMTS